ncbi:class I SAM-dependent methyltransferase [Pseudonocardia acaciae]|uniref:class I SAM-dependent methyltransferase n=1 Tax=Pseudonocardia acaciae TaxID=551276 RepID=UPI00068519C0|nr:class I SAM-dependent methyltransferase [Pseudonocardia acaciae]
MANYQDSSSAPVVNENDRALSFGTVAQAYSEYRPNYPDTAIDWALAPLAAPMHVLDLAAGTGKLTASLVRRPGTTVTAVEPDPNMLAVLRAELPEVAAVPGTAEQIPLPDDSVHAVLVGQAFHWFDHERALTEIARVLRPGGVVGALWNHEDNTVGWVAGYHEAENRERRVAGMKTGGDAPEPLVHPAFEPVERSDFDHSMRTTVNRLIGTLSTHSWSLVSTPEEREAAYRRIRVYLAGVPELGLSGAGAEDREFELPLRTIVLRAVLRAERR